ncbi:MAG: acyl-CoA dehydrogenase family protein [Alphaproteobacteria bacterium]|nr:acyl-CoA dehydrogenase family protein [Alphaproteobacteria bacterium]
MSPLNPRATLATHEVTNQPPPFENINLFATDTALRDAVKREGGEPHAAHLNSFGTRVGSAEVIAWGFDANRNAPELKTFDRFGRRIDEVNFHPSYHKLMELGLEGGVASLAWTAQNGGHVAHTAILYMMAQIEQGVCCPMTMTYAALPALRHQPDLSREWEPRITAGRYDASSQPAGTKRGVTIGMAMTEKQGGSDVRANTTKATPTGDGAFTLTGHKWFCSAPMCDAFLTLAYTDKGLTCFLVPRWKPDGERNAMHIMRLKDKLGDRANASSEIEYHGAYARQVGEEGRGVKTIIEMVHHTRLDCTIAPAAYMRQALAQALWHTSHRTAFQKKLIDQPLMARVLADLALESEAATALAFRIARSFDDGKSAALFSRLATPIGKYWLNKRVVNFVYEAMECHGGAGYVEESILPRLFRQSPLNSIWEGSGNVICLDVLRALTREPETADALFAELDQARGAYASLDKAIDNAKQSLTAVTEPGARRLVETLALTLQASLLARHAPTAIADGFIATRLGDTPWRTYGAFEAEIDVGAIVARAMPAA